MEKIRRLTLCFVVFMLTLSGPSYAGMSGGLMFNGYNGSGMTLNNSQNTNGENGNKSKKMARKWQRMSHWNKLQMMEQMINDPGMYNEVINRVMEQTATNPEFMSQMTDYILTNSNFMNQFIEQMMENQNIREQISEHMLYNPVP